MKPLKAVYPGSFDPLTLGHVDIIRRVSTLFDEIVVLVAKSPVKNQLFTPEQRVELAKDALKEFPNVTVESSEGLTVDFVNKIGGKVIVRGLRSAADFDLERTMAHANRHMCDGVETFVVFASPSLSFVSSTMVKEIATFGGPVKGLVPESIEKALNERK